MQELSYHPNIVKLVDVFALETRKTPCMVIEFLQNGSVKDFLDVKSSEKDKVFLSASQIKNIAKQILTGVQFMHLNYVMHRDLKPDNLMIDHKGTVKLIDFNMAK